MKLNLSKFSLKSDNPLVDSYNRFIAFIFSSALLLQAYISPFFESFLMPGGAVVRNIQDGNESGLFTLGLSTIAFVVSAGVVYVVWAKGMLLFYKKCLWHRLNNRYCIMGVWDAGFAFQANTNSEETDRPTGFVRFQQDYLGKIEADLYYNYNEKTGQYLSESTMTGYLTGNTDKPCFRIFFKTRHFGGAKFSSVADASDGIEIVEATVFSATNTYPTRLFGDFSFYKRSREKELWSGHTVYTRKDDLSIAHKIDDGYSAT